MGAYLLPPGGGRQPQSPAILAASGQGSDPRRTPVFSSMGSVLGHSGKLTRYWKLERGPNVGTEWKGQIQETLMGETGEWRKKIRGS